MINKIREKAPTAGWWLVGLLVVWAAPARADEFAYVTTVTQAFGTLDLNTGAFTQAGGV